MILTNEQLRPCLSGAVEIAEQNGVLIPYRFGGYMREEVYAKPNRFNPKMTQSAGVVCRFTTTSKTLAFTYTVEEVSSEQNFDVWVNGIFLSHTVCSTLKGRIEMALPYDISSQEELQQRYELFTRLPFSCKVSQKRSYSACLPLSKPSSTPLL